MPRDVKLMIIERTMPELADCHGPTEAFMTDLEMLVMSPGGRERAGSPCFADPAVQSKLLRLTCFSALWAWSDPDERNGGELQRRRLRAASLWVLRENERARRFYEKLGGDTVGDQQDIREDGVVFVEVPYGWGDLGALAQRANAVDGDKKDDRSSRV
jgi:hypothetical protein